MGSDEIQGSSRRFGRVHVLRVTFFGASIDCLPRHVAKPPVALGQWYPASGDMTYIEASPSFGVILLTEKKLHHLGCSKCWLVIPHYQNLVWGMPSGAGIFPYQLCGYSVDICFGSATTWTKSGAR